MNIKVIVNSDFKNAEGFMRTLPITFANNGQTLKDDRNEIKIIDYEGLKLCIKSFNRVTAFNRNMYSWFNLRFSIRRFFIKKVLGVYKPRNKRERVVKESGVSLNYNVRLFTCSLFIANKY